MLGKCTADISLDLMIEYYIQTLLNGTADQIHHKLESCSSLSIEPHVKADEKGGEDEGHGQHLDADGDGGEDEEQFPTHNPDNRRD